MNDVLKNEGRFTLIAGPCALEPGDGALRAAVQVKEICEKLDILYYFKVSIDKANRTSATKYRGLGFEKGIETLYEIKKKAGVKIVTDIHEPWQADPVAEIADIIQIPAFLCRQTDLLKAAAETGKIINVKKAQFMSPEEMENVAKKIEYFGNRQILLCERGSSFGYHQLVVDMTGLVRMKRFGYPIVFDATHSVQLSGVGENNSNSGNREYVPALAKAAIATGAVNALFMEVAEEPDKALCDGSCMLKISNLEKLLSHLVKIHELNRMPEYETV